MGVSSISPKRHWYKNYKTHSMPIVHPYKHPQITRSVIFLPKKKIGASLDRCFYNFSPHVSSCQIINNLNISKV